MRLGREGRPSDYGTSDHFEHSIAILWPDHIEETEGILFFFLVRYLRRMERARPATPDESSATPVTISPVEYMIATDELIEDCQAGQDRHSGYSMPPRLRNLAAERYAELRQTISRWALIAFDQQFVDELEVIVRQQNPDTTT